MAGGILPGIALINNFDANAELMRGAKLYIYQAGTVTPITAYKDSGLTSGQEQPWPVLADSAARLPMFYLPDGDYRVRLASDDGSYVAYDIPILSAVLPSGGGSGGGGSVSPQVLFQTGDLKHRLGSGVIDGFVRLNGRTIGSSTSGASERANADTQALYEYLYDEFSDAICSVVGGRGASATADYNAGKPLTLIDGRGKTLFGADGMGSSRANKLTTATFATPDTVGSVGGANDANPILQTHLPAIKPAITITDPGHSHNYTRPTNTSPVNNGGDFNASFANNSDTVESHGTGITAAFTNNLGSGTALPTAPPGVIVTYYVKL